MQKDTSTDEIELVANLHGADGSRVWGVARGYNYGWKYVREFNVKLVPISGGDYVISLNLSSWGMSTAVRMVLSEKTVASLKDSTTKAA